MLFLSLLILLQPALLLYDRIVMEGAASRAARLAATASPAAVERGAVEEIARTYLGAIPPVGIFHVHEGGCSYEITVLGDESSEEVTVDIVNKVDPLPLIGIGAAGLGLTDGSGRFTVEVSATEPTQPDWVWDSGAGAPGDWAGRWM